MPNDTVMIEQRMMKKIRRRILPWVFLLYVTHSWTGSQANLSQLFNGTSALVIKSVGDIHRAAKW